MTVLELVRKMVAEKSTWDGNGYAIHLHAIFRHWTGIRIPWIRKTGNGLYVQMHCYDEDDAHRIPKYLEIERYDFVTIQGQSVWFLLTIPYGEFFPLED
jgi:hypothetical protein